jgi:hypothetical protein
MDDEEARQGRIEVKGYAIRRSPRALVNIPVVIKRTGKHGYSFEEDTHTFQVSKYGACIFSIHELEEDSMLQLGLKSSEHWLDFHVVWISRENASALSLSSQPTSLEYLFKGTTGPD